jgi:hypothetical protein
VKEEEHNDEKAAWSLGQGVNQRIPDEKRGSASSVDLAYWGSAAPNIAA